MSSPARTPEPPYYVVTFVSQRTVGDHGYGAAADRMEELVARQSGYLGHDSARDADGFGITSAYFADDAAIAGWRDQVDHAQTREQGRRDWYEAYQVHVARVERAYRWERSDRAPS